MRRKPAALGRFWHVLGSFDGFSGCGVPNSPKLWLGALEVPGMVFGLRLSFGVVVWAFGAFLACFWNFWDTFHIFWPRGIIPEGNW